MTIILFQRESYVIDSHFQSNKIHSPGTVAEYFLNVVKKAGNIAWDSSVAGQYSFVHSLKNAIDGMQNVRHNNSYIDVHAWCFVPHSFRLLIHDLFSLGLIPFKEVDFFSTEGCEFYVALSRDGKGIGESRLSILDKIELEISNSQIKVEKSDLNLAQKSKIIVKNFVRKIGSILRGS